MSLTLPTPEMFPAFPFLPYDIQLSLMRHLYENIENRRVTVVESPTGTGKTLSLLCATLTWLRDEQERARKGQISAGDEQAAMDWVLAQTIDRKRRQLEADEMEYAERLARARKKELIMRKAAKARVRKKSKAATTERPTVDLDLDDDCFLPESADGSSQDENDNLSPAVRALMQKLEKAKSGATMTTREAEPTCTKIYYTSRTHSQLSQVLHELEKLNISLSPSFVISLHSKPTGDMTSSTSTQPVVDVRVVSLGSRKQLCVNERLKNKGTDLDEACRQLLSEKGDKRCSYLPPADDETKMLDFRDQVLATPKDIESLVESGMESRTCPYFGSRRAIAQAQLVLLPYNLLLQKAARESLGIDLKDQVVVIDEAHNLISTLLSLSTAHLPLRTLNMSLHQVSIYLNKFRNRLSTEHSIHLKRLVGLLEALSHYADEWKIERLNNSGKTAGKDATEVFTSGELMGRLGRKFEGVNMLEIEKYLRNSKIARKISGYCTNAMEKAAGQAKLARLTATTPPLHAVENFIVALTAANDDGRVSLSLVGDQVDIKYQHLNPATYFQEVVQATRSVVLAGGTMSPISDVTAQLFPLVAPERLTTFSCGHIVPPNSLQTLVVKSGPKGSQMQFKYDSRNDQALIAELGQLLTNFASLVPGGMVVFVPSYAFLNTVVGAWEKSGLMERLGAKKKVFSEPQESGDVDAVLRDYAAEVQSIHGTTPSEGKKKRGALLFAVVGAKLSEGLNFSDDLARAVVIVGLPFANLASPELRERMSYVNRQQQKRGAKVAGVKDAGTELYENMCMNAVNQSIGRAIRHRGDWASLVLLDSRYASPRIRGKLPKWIGKDVTVTETFGEAMKEMGKFYREKRSAA
ncbi:hypothetical protein PHLGIDRAFT_103970 [Phlebiopsis gigantea 11061_1 CR5-6]|uniref:ATP-dependent DNA helicase CHL1 n=1 Tax=Phlebiopsis gigantea (strain 11061_1 CR5-6) TaxID=745531 RepID=A0A0C3PP28_PHLG1|nr:hypothetical protein PHLGIDRAFT_103970 [Phlebiopsis gigantea 11061_1 CR5-6]